MKLQAAAAYVTANLHKSAPADLVFGAVKYYKLGKRDAKILAEMFVTV